MVVASILVRFRASGFRGPNGFDEKDGRSLGMEKGPLGISDGEILLRDGEPWIDRVLGILVFLGVCACFYGG